MSFGRVLVSQQGITLSARYPLSELIPWSQVKSVAGLPNGIFLPALLHHAAGNTA